MVLHTEHTALSNVTNDLISSPSQLQDTAVADAHYLAWLVRLGRQSGNRPN